MMALLAHEILGYAISRDGMAALATNDRLKAKDFRLKAYSTILLSLGDDEVLREEVDED